MAQVTGNGRVGGIGGPKRPAEGAVCDDCKKKPATRLFLVESDSFGSEYSELCDDCHYKSGKDRDKWQYDAKCDWCGATDCEKTRRRDPDGGMDAALDIVCLECGAKLDKELEREARRHAELYGEDDYGYY